MSKYKKRWGVSTEDEGTNYFDSFEKADAFAKSEAEDSPGVDFHIYETVAVRVASEPKARLIKL